MKFNLKNRPKKALPPKADRVDAINLLVENNKWFEGFEKELREMMGKMIWNSQARIIKEILGE